MLSNHFTQWLNVRLDGNLYTRRYRMTFIVTVQTAIFAFLLIAIMPEHNPWIVIAMVSAGIVVSVLNLIALKQYHCVTFSSYLLTSLVFIVAMGCNIVAGGTESSLFIWLYLVPIIAAAVIGFGGLLLFGSLSTATIDPAYPYLSAFASTNMVHTITELYFRHDLDILCLCVISH